MSTASVIQVCGIVAESITDGPGLRTAVFTQGCPHHCPGCHNPQSHAFTGGETKTVDALLRKVTANPLLSGVTLTGGEPLCQAAALAELASGVKEAGLEVAVYTGYRWEDLMRQRDDDVMALLQHTDILVDGPFLQDEKSLELRFKGSRNQRVIDVQQSLSSNELVLETSARWT